LAAAMKELEIEQEACGSAPQALELLAQRYYSALVVDFDLPTASQLVRLARMAPAQRRPVVFAMIGARTDVGGTFQSGANFVLYKPLVVSQVLRSLRAGRGFMRADRRRAPRQKNRNTRLPPFRRLVRRTGHGAQPERTRPGSGGSAAAAHWPGAFTFYFAGKRASDRGRGRGHLVRRRWPRRNTLQ
jgi:DNA-binding response OmpR family regulator